MIVLNINDLLFTYTDLFSDALVRVIFFVIQVLLLLIFETKMHYFQYKLLALLLANAVLILFSVQVNPIATFLGLVLLSDPYFRR